MPPAERGPEFDLEPDEDGYPQARDRLTESFARWAAARGKPVERWIADLFCDFQHGYRGGHLGRWYVDDVHELLDDWFPRKVNLDAEDVERVVPTLVAFLAYLEDDGLLAPGSDPPKRLRRVAGQHDVSFFESMTDASRFGPAKAMFTAMTSEGVDATDEEAVGRWIDDFNARPFAERDGVLGPSLDASHDEDRSLPPTVLPSPEELAASASAAPILERFGRLVAFVGDGRKLTAKGNLTVADGKALVAILGTDDEVDPDIGTRTFRTRSSTVLHGVDLTFRWAKAAGFLRVQHGKVLTTKKGRALERDPVRAFEQACRGLLKLGPLGAQRPGWRRGWEEFLDGGTANLLTALLAGDPVPFDDLAESAWEEVDAAFVLPESPYIDWRDAIARDVSDGLETLELAGVLTRADDERIVTEWGLEDREGGEVSLTPAGRWLAHRLAEEMGYDAPVAGGLADTDADMLLEQCAELPLDEAEAELAAWCARRDASDAAGELANAARRGGFDAGMIAFAGFEMIGDTAEPAVRTLIDDPETGATALLWLVQRGFEDRAALRRQASGLMVELLASFLRKDGAEGLMAELGELGPVDEQRALMEQVWRSPSPRAAEVLDAIGRHHPDKAVAKAARKALFQHRSAQANTAGR
ncbi:MAG: hypothetical protein ACT452_12815 [Microthrixaceae bacterium]